MLSCSLLLAAVSGLTACHHDAAPPVVPAEAIPLPPISRTPIQLLLDHDGDLGLSPDQKVNLSSLDTELAQKNAPLQEQLDETSHPDKIEAPPDPDAGKVTAGGGKHGRTSASLARMTPEERQEMTQRRRENHDKTAPMHNQIDANVHLAVSAALASFDAGQRAKAVAILTDGGYQRFTDDVPNPVPFRARIGTELPPPVPTPLPAPIETPIPPPPPAK